MNRERARRVGTVVVLALLVVTGALLATAIQFSSEPSYVDGEIPLGASGGPTVTLVADGETQVNLEDPWNGDQLDIETGAGNITVGGDPGANATIAVNDITGTETVATEISGGSDWLHLNPEDKQRLDIRGDVSAVRFQSVGVDDGSDDLEIVGTSGGAGEVRLYDLPANQELVLSDPSDGDVLATGQTDSSGTLNTSVDLTESNQRVRVRSASSFDGVSLSNPTPSGNVTEIPDQLSVDVAAEGYPVDVEFTLEGSVVATETTATGGTVSTDVDISNLGEYNWSATATDEVGNTDTLDTSFQTPSELVIREETDPTTVINDSTVTVRFFTSDGDIAIERQTSNGRLDMEGLPASEFTVFVESENYYDRRVYLNSIFEQEDLYILNSTEYPRSEGEAVASRFLYTDLTGDFPRADTTVQVQRAIDLNGDGTSEFRTVAGDYWGAGGEFQVILEHGARYRLFVENQETGATDIVGTHIPTEDLSYDIRTSGLTQEAQNASGVYANAQLDTDDGVIDVVYDDPANQTENLAIVVKSRDGETEIFNETISGPLGSYRDAIDLNESQLEKDWVVEIRSDRHNAAIPVGSGAVGLPVDVPGWLITLLMSMAVTFVGALYGPRTATLGAWAMVFVASGVAMFGWAFGWPSIVAATLIAVAMTFYGKVMP